MTASKTFKRGERKKELCICISTTVQGFVQTHTGKDLQEGEEDEKNKFLFHQQPIF